MTRNNLHIIGKEIISIEAIGTDGFKLQNEISSIAGGRLNNRLSEVLDKFADADKYIKLDRINLKIKGVDPVVQADLFIDSVADELERQLIISIDDGVSKNKTELFSDAFIFFLQNGYMPWWIQITNLKEFESEFANLFDEILESEREYFIKKFIEISFISENVPRRIIYEFSDDFFLKLANLLSIKGYYDSIELLNYIILQINQTSLLNSFQKTSSVNEIKLNYLKLQVFCSDKKKTEQWLYLIFENIYSRISDKKILGKVFKYGEVSDSLKKLMINTFGNSSENFKNEKSYLIYLNEILPDIFKNDIYVKMRNKIEDKKKDETDDTECIENGEEIYIDNAGLVIIASFLPKFFEKCGIYSDDKKKLKDKEKAMILSQYIICGSDSISETDLVLNKILCAYPVNEPVNNLTRITEFEKIETERLLKSVIGLWAVLKDTSVDGLRESFLLRKGKLTKVESGWLLRVEQKSYDMLLDHLSWTINMIKLPWMDDLLTVEWFY